VTPFKRRCSYASLGLVILASILTFGCIGVRENSNGTTSVDLAVDSVPLQTKVSFGFLNLWRNSWSGTNDTYFTNTLPQGTNVMFGQ